MDDELDLQSHAETEQSSLPSSAPPQPAPQHVPAANLHPVWQAAGSCVTRRAARAAAAAGAAALRPRRGRRAVARPVNISNLQQQIFETMNDADSVAFSDEEEAPPAKRSKAKATADNDSDESEEEEDEEPNDRTRINGMIDAAAFGGGGGGKHYAASDDGSLPSEALSKRKRQAKKDVYAVRNEECVGCMLAGRLGPVNRFIRSHFLEMAPEALWKMAALKFKTDVSDPAAREGNPVPSFGWKELQAHYEVCSMSNVIQKMSILRDLQNVRTTLRFRMMKTENGLSEPDFGVQKMLLQVQKEERAVRAELEQEMNGKTGNSKKTT